MTKTDWNDILQYCIRPVATKLMATHAELSWIAENDATHILNQCESSYLLMRHRVKTDPSDDGRRRLSRYQTAAAVAKTILDTKPFVIRGNHAKSHEAWLANERLALDSAIATLRLVGLKEASSNNDDFLMFAFDQDFILPHKPSAFSADLCTSMRLDASFSPYLFANTLTVLEAFHLSQVHSQLQPQS